ncbi:hypothetical protein [Schumannella luteola]
MSDVTGQISENEVEPGVRHPRHRRDDVPVDGGAEPDLAEFGENPDTELAG